MMAKARKAVFISLYTVLSVFLLLLGAADAGIENSISVFEDQEIDVPGYAFIEYSGFDSTEVYPGGVEVKKTDGVAKVFGIPVKKVALSVYKDLSVIPGGESFGVKLRTRGVQVVGTGSLGAEDGTSGPASEAGIKANDIILRANGVEISSAAEFTKMISESGGKEIKIVYQREGKIYETSLYAKEDGSGGYKAGIWVKDTVAGIGTLTYVIPGENVFGGLGHGICDTNTGELLPFYSGEVYNTVITGVKVGKNGEPGELRGYFCEGAKGQLTSNTETGVFGVFDKNGNKKASVKIGLKNSVKEGAVKIMCTVDESGVKEYDAEITRIISADSETKNFIVRITDERLLKKTGGIVQGMSGSPVLQDGKLIGAVTHVLVNDPERGYGIFIENMLKND